MLKQAFLRTQVLLIELATSFVYLRSQQEVTWTGSSGVDEMIVIYFWASCHETMEQICLVRESSNTIAARFLLFTRRYPAQSPETHLEEMTPIRWMQLLCSTMSSSMPLI